MAAASHLYSGRLDYPRIFRSSRFLVESDWDTSALTFGWELVLEGTKLNCRRADCSLTGTYRSPDLRAD